MSIVYTHSSARLVTVSCANDESYCSGGQHDRPEFLAVMLKERSLERALPPLWVKDFGRWETRVCHAGLLHNSFHHLHRKPSPSGRKSVYRQYSFYQRLRVSQVQAVP